MGKANGCFVDGIAFLYLSQADNTTKGILWSLAKQILSGIAHKLIICRLLLNLTISFVRFRPLTTFNRPDSAVR
jgi:hypothetical protein